MRGVIIAVAIAGLSTFPKSSSAQTPDATKTAVFNSALAERLANLKCTILKTEVSGIGVGLDNDDHKVKAASYIIKPDGDEAKGDVTLTYKTSPDAVVPASISEDVTTTIMIGKDCKITKLNVDGAGDLGKLIIKAAHFLNVFQQPMQDVVSKVCTPR